MKLKDGAWGRATECRGAHETGISLTPKRYTLYREDMSVCVCLSSQKQNFNTFRDTSDEAKTTSRVKVSVGCGMG